MASIKLAGRYAKSLLDLMNENNSADKAYADMQLILDVCAESKDFTIMLKSPIINVDKKLAVLREIFSGKVNEVTMAFIELLTNKNREGAIKEIAQSYVDLYKDGKGIKTATVTSAAKLSDEARKKVLDIVKAGIDKDVILKEVVDENIIGGFVLRVKDKQVDASLSGLINDLKQDFSKNLYIKDF